MHIRNIKIVGTTYSGSKVLKHGSKFDCDDVNIFVGDQGVGKSTLLNMIFKHHTDLQISLSKQAEEYGIETYFFDSEKDNPRMKHPNDYTNPNGTNKSIGYGGCLASKFKSHGEVLEEFIINLIRESNNCIIFLDEPESGLSITNQFILIKEIKEAVKRKCQFFIASHCYPIIMEFDVISLDHNIKFKGNEFINDIINKL